MHFNRRHFFLTILAVPAGAVGLFLYKNHIPDTLKKNLRALLNSPSLDPRLYLNRYELFSCSMHAAAFVSRYKHMGNKDEFFKDLNRQEALDFESLNTVEIEGFTFSQTFIGLLLISSKNYENTDS